MGAMVLPLKLGACVPSRGYGFRPALGAFWKSAV